MPQPTCIPALTTASVDSDLGSGITISLELPQGISPEMGAYLDSLSQAYQDLFAKYGAALSAMNAATEYNNKIIGDRLSAIYGYLFNPSNIEFNNITVTGLINQDIIVGDIADHGYTGLCLKDSTVDTNAFGIFAALYQAADTHFDTALATATTTMPCLALALETGTGDKDVLLQGIVRDDSWTWSCGLVYVSKDTAGALTQTAPSTTGQQVQIIGWALAANILYFNPMYPMVEIA